MFENLDKILKSFVKQATDSLEQDAKNFERKARNARATAALIKKIAPELLKTLKPRKFKPLSKAEIKRLNKKFRIPVPPLPGPNMQ